MKFVALVGPKIGLDLLKILLENINQNHLLILHDERLDIKSLNYSLNSRVRFLKIDQNFQTMPEIEGTYFLNLWGSTFLTKEFISRFKMCFNIHPSYLPFGRGRDPIIWTILNQWPAGATFHLIDEDIDTGPILYQEEIDWKLPITGIELYNRVLATCLHVFEVGLQRLIDGEFNLNPQQNADLVTHKRSDTDLIRNISVEDLSEQTGEYLIRHFLAFDFGKDYSSRITLQNRCFSVRLILEEIATLKYNELE